MCRSVADGGQRCAAHTRAAFASVEQTAAVGAPAWSAAAAEYASTSEGAKHFEHAAREARMEGRVDDEMAIRQAVRQGDVQRQVNDETRLRIIQAENPHAPSYKGHPTRLVGDSAAIHSDGDIQQVFRPYDRRSNTLRFVREPDGSIWSVNKHGVVMQSKADPALPGSGWGVLEFATNEKQRALKDTVRAVDPSFSGCRCCYSGLR